MSSGSSSPRSWRPEALGRARATFEQNIRGEPPRRLLGRPRRRRERPSGSRSARCRSAERHHAIGMFGLARPVTGERPPPKIDDRLTPRQQEILQRLAEGAVDRGDRRGSLVLSRETVRNHIRHILQRLGVRSRLAAIAVRTPRGPRLSRLTEAAR